jgi:hypothetical protein
MMDLTCCYCSSPVALGIELAEKLYDQHNHERTQATCGNSDNTTEHVSPPPSSSTNILSQNCLLVLYTVTTSAGSEDQRSCGQGPRVEGSRSRVKGRRSRVKGRGSKVNRRSSGRGQGQGSRAASYWRFRVIITRVKGQGSYQGSRVKGQGSYQGSRVKGQGSRVITRVIIRVKGQGQGSRVISRVNLAYHRARHVAFASITLPHTAPQHMKFQGKAKER